MNNFLNVLIMMRLPVKYLELVRIFKEASRNLKVPTFQDIENAKNLKTIDAYTESTDLILKAFKQIIHLVTLSLSRGRRS
jgi:hypothetical protein